MATANWLLKLVKTLHVSSNFVASVCE